MPAYKLLGINSDLGLLTPRQLDPDSDSLVMSNYTPTGGTGNPFLIVPAAAIPVSQQLFDIQDATAGSILEITNVASTFTGTFTGDWIVTGDLTVTGSTTFSIGLDAVITGSPIDNTVSIPTGNELVFNDGGIAIAGALMSLAKTAGTTDALAISMTGTSSGHGVSVTDGTGTLTLDAGALSQDGGTLNILTADNGAGAGHVMTVAAGAGTTFGGSISIITGAGTAGVSGALALSVPNGTAGGGAITMAAGDGSGVGAFGGAVTITAGEGFSDTGTSSGVGAAMSLSSGQGGSTAGTGGFASAGGTLSITAGNGGNDSFGDGSPGNGGSLNLQAGSSGTGGSPGQGGTISINSGSSTGGNPGLVQINTNTGSGSLVFGNTTDRTSSRFNGPVTIDYSSFGNGFLVQNATAVGQFAVSTGITTTAAPEVAGLVTPASFSAPGILFDPAGIGVTGNITRNIGIYVTNDDPNAEFSAAAGSLALRDSGQVWVNMDGATTWSQLAVAAGASDLSAVIALNGNTATITDGNEVDLTDGGVSVTGSLLTLRKTVGGGAPILDIIQSGAATGNAVSITQDPSNTALSITDGTNTASYNANVIGGTNGSSMLFAGGPSTLVAGGNASLVAGQTTAAGLAGGSISIISGDSTGVGGTAGPVTIAGGSATDATGVGGNVTVNGGFGVSSNGSLGLGTSNTSAISIGSASIATTMFHAEVASSAGNTSVQLNSARTFAGVGTAIAVGSYAIGVDASSLTNINSANAISNPDLQEVLESIDAAIGLSGSPTFQSVYDNDTDGLEVTLTTNATDGDVIFAGTEAVQITAANGLNLDAPFDFDSTSFDVQMTGSNGFSIDGTAASNVSANGDLSLIASGLGNIIIDSVSANVTIDASAALTTTTGTVDINTGAMTIDASLLSIDSTSTTNFTVTNANLTFGTAGSGSVDFNAATSLTIDAGSTMSLDAAGTSNFTVTASDAANLNFSIGITNAGAGAGNLLLSADDEVDISATTLDFNASGAFTIDSSASSFIRANGAAVDLSFEARNITIPLNEADFTAGGNTVEGGDLTDFTASSIVGALNELLVASTGAHSLTVATANSISGRCFVAINASGEAEEASASAGDNYNLVGVNLNNTVEAAGTSVSIGNSGYINGLAAATINEGDLLILTKAAASAGRVLPDTSTGDATHYPDSGDFLCYVGRAVTSATSGGAVLISVNIERPISI